MGGTTEFPGEGYAALAAAKQARGAARHEIAIREIAGLNGGYPVVGDTRIPVRLIVEARRETGDLSRTVEAFPQLTPEQASAALDYYEQNPARVDEDSEQNARALRELQDR